MLLTLLIVTKSSLNSYLLIHDILRRILLRRLLERAGLHTKAMNILRLKWALAQIRLKVANIAANLLIEI